MPTFRIRELDEDLHGKLKILAIRKKTTLEELIKLILKNYVDGGENGNS